MPNTKEAVELARTILVNDPDGLYTEQSEMILAKAVLELSGRVEDMEAEDAYEISVLRAALQEISNQNLISEMHPDLVDGDYEGAYEGFIKIVRAALSTTKGEDQKNA